ncbi:MAG TPA: bifunctional 4-hydroxy-2-oxoglutarate aldolase/2-dehydro-3-deoxy-phosphogluconate aldolase [Bryobacteraceae bacterium]|nr:bifunctional 4-hydroxy-2-oxoglutarate aldolase/2-dehydro-3-deoxy-phosphogluconate aldolase [Bryobacteraceae bacterium]
MTREEIRTRILGVGIIPAVRVYSESEALFAAEAVCSSGIPIVELTMTIPGAIGVIAQLTRYRTDIIVGAGTISDVETACRCLDAGAAFLTTPGLDLEIVDFALKRNVAILPGALTPGEIMAAWKAGCEFVKVFPCAQLGGPDYIRALKGPFPQIPLVASGGVNQKNAGDYIRAGAAALGIGQHLIHQNAIKKRQREWIHELARRYTNMVNEARGAQAV